MKAKKNEDLSARAGRALRRAGRTARKIARASRTPVYVLKNGKIVALQPRASSANNESDR